MIFTKIVLTNFHEGFWILKFLFHNKNFTIKNDWKKPAETSQFRIIKVASSKISNSDSVEVKIFSYFSGKTEFIKIILWDVYGEIGETTTFVER